MHSCIKATKRLLLGWLLCVSLAVAEDRKADRQFVSLTLCSDRLLMAIARPEQIAAMSPYSKNPLMMLDKVNVDKPTLEPQLSQLLPYADTTLLINEHFYPRLVKRLKALNFRIIGINDNPQTPQELYQLIRTLGQVTDNEKTAEQLVNHLKSFKKPTAYPTLSPILPPTLILTETGVANQSLPQFRVLLNLLGLSPIDGEISQQNFSLEKLLLSHPAVIITLADQHGYHDQGQWLSHPLLNDLTRDIPMATAPLNYTYCFDHGVWQGAGVLRRQLNTDSP